MFLGVLFVMAQNTHTQKQKSRQIQEDFYIYKKGKHFFTELSKSRLVR